LFAKVERRKEEAFQQVSELLSHYSLDLSKASPLSRAPKPMQQLSLREESGESASSDEEIREDKMDVVGSTEQTTLPTPAPKPAIEMKIDDEENPF
jgi:hypothetical protein